MTVTVQLTAQQTAERLIPVLRNYADKFAGINQDLADMYIQLASGKGWAGYGLNAARLICLRDTLDKPASAIGQNASGLLEHAELEHVTWIELKLRLDEFEEHCRFSQMMAAKMVELLKRHPDVASIRKDVEQTRYKAPF